MAIPISPNLTASNSKAERLQSGPIQIGGLTVQSRDKSLLQQATVPLLIVAAVGLGLAALRR